MPKAFYDSGNTDDAISQRDNDWCICVADSSLENKYGYLSVSSEYTMANCYNFACGYPLTDSTNSNYNQLCYSPAYEKYYVDTTAGKDSGMFSLANYILGGMSGGPVIFYYENSMTFEQYEGVSSIITRSDKNNGHGYSVKVTNKMIETLKEANKL